MVSYQAKSSKKGNDPQISFDSGIHPWAGLSSIVTNQWKKHCLIHFRSVCNSSVIRRICLFSKKMLIWANFLFTEMDKMPSFFVTHGPRGGVSSGRGSNPCGEPSLTSGVHGCREARAREDWPSFHFSAPAIFPMVWKIAKGFLREDMRRIVEVYGGTNSVPISRVNIQAFCL